MKRAEGGDLQNFSGLTRHSAGGFPGFKNSITSDPLLQAADDVSREPAAVISAGLAFACSKIHAARDIVMVSFDGVK